VSTPRDCTLPSNAAPERLVTDAGIPTRSPSQSVADTPPATTGLRALNRLVAAYGPERLSARPPTVAAAEGLAAAVRLLCAEARHADPGRGERMVIALHAAWPTLPAVQHLPPGDGRDGLLARVVTLAIAEFYAPTRGGDETGDGADGAQETRL
jgi:hypothetical protein